MLFITVRSVARSRAFSGSPGLSAPPYVGCPAPFSGRANPWLVMFEKAHRSSVALSMRLRLSPQSRLDRKTVGVKPGGASAYEIMSMMEQGSDE